MSPVRCFTWRTAAGRADVEHTVVKFEKVGYHQRMIQHAVSGDAREIRIADCGE